jgi:hypothetical protein
MKFITLLILLPWMAYSNTDAVDKVCKRMKYEDCSLVKAIITVESDYNPLAIGRDGAGSLGLMQIKCSTARMLDQVHGRSLIKCSRLFIPEINIVYGIEYLKYLDKLLTIKPKMHELLSAYNGGYLYSKNTKSYMIKECNAISVKKKRKCKKGEPFNVEYSKKVITVYKQIQGE